MILSNNTSGPSTRLLATELELITGIKLLVSREAIRGKKIHVNYGSGHAPPDCTINSAEFACLCGSKKRFSDLLLANDIHTPEFKHGALMYFHRYSGRTCTRMVVGVFIW